MTAKIIEMKNQRRRYSDQFDFAGTGYFTLDHSGKIIKGTSRGARLLGGALDEIPNRHFRDFVADDFQDRFNIHCEQVLESRAMHSCDLKLLKDGRHPLYVQIESIAVKSREGNNRQIQIAVTEITERKQVEKALLKAREGLEKRVAERTAELAEANKELRQRITECEFAQSALQESELKYSTLVEDALIGVYIAQDDNIVFANDKFAEIYGYPKEELVGMESLNLVHPEDKAMVTELREKRLKGKKVPSEYEIRGLKKNGTTIWVMRSYSLIHYEGRPAISGIVADRTTRRLAEDALRKSDKELRILSNQLLSAEEKERKRMARELHDGIGQSLSAIKFSVENTLRELQDRSALSDSASLEAVIPITQKTIEEVRRIVKDLRPSILDDLGILATIAWFCREFQTVYSNIQIETQIDITENDIPLPLKTTIYRVLQEALNNVAKHSEADRVQLSVQKRADKIALRVKDNGRGFDLENTISLTPSQRGFGLASMRERAQLSGAHFEIKSEIGNGTIIRVVWDGGFRDSGIEGFRD
jgi:PAS domain S-box-containing protein